MSAADILRKLDAEATDGPWEAFPHNFAPLSSEYRRYAVVAHPSGLCSVGHGLFAETDMHPETANGDAALIATLRNALPELAALVEWCLYRVPGKWWRCRSCGEWDPVAVVHRPGCVLAALEAKLAEAER